MEHRIRMRAIALAVGSTLILAACGGGGSSNQSVSGIAAEGLAIANAVVTIKDATGATRSVTTDASGNYVFDTSGLSFPLMLQVTGTKGVWHALVTEDDRGKSANINNATNSVALLALGATTTADLQAAFLARVAIDQIFACRADIDIAGRLIGEVGLHIHALDAVPRGFRPGHGHSDPISVAGEDLRTAEIALVRNDVQIIPSEGVFGSH